MYVDTSQNHLEHRSSLCQKKPLLLSKIYHKSNFKDMEYEYTQYTQYTKICNMLKCLIKKKVKKTFILFTNIM